MDSLEEHVRAIPDTMASAACPRTAEEAREVTPNRTAGAGLALAAALRAAARQSRVPVRMLAWVRYIPIYP